VGVADALEAVGLQVFEFFDLGQVVELVVDEEIQTIEIGSTVSGRRLKTR
jgi:hypothetical protein